jgi:hypothetical protein
VQVTPLERINEKIHEIGETVHGHLQDFLKVFGITLDTVKVLIFPRDESRYRRRFIPPPTREHPDPDPMHLTPVQQFRDVEERINQVDTRVRGAAVPTNDRIWQRHRNELDTLARLGNCDVLLIGASKELADVVGGLPQDRAIDPDNEERIDAHIAKLSAVLSQRNAILAQF